MSDENEIELPPRIVVAVIVLLSEGDRDGARLLLSGRSKEELVDALLRTADIQLGSMDPPCRENYWTRCARS